MTTLRSLTRSAAVLAVIDVQDKLLSIMDDTITERTIGHINLVSRMFQHWSRPVLVTEQTPRALGHTAAAITSELPAAAPIEKHTFSCCAEPRFLEALQAQRPAHVILTGMEAHVCVLQTALDCLERGYGVFVLSDAVQSSSKLNWRGGLDYLAHQGVHVVPTETLLFQLLQQAGTEEFRYFIQQLKELG